MDFTQWMNEKLPQIVNKFEQGTYNGSDEEIDDGLDLAGRNEIYEVLDDILAVFFPNYYSKVKVAKEDAGFFIADMLRHISFNLGKHIREVFKYRCLRDKCDSGCCCEEKAQSVLADFVESLPRIRAVIFEDIKSAHESDPAAKFFDEVILSYPFVEAVATHRIAHKLYSLDVPIIPRIMSERAHSRTGIDIHPGAQIGPRFFIDHGTGVVIGETSRIGSNVKMYHGVGLIAKSPYDKDGKPRTGQKRHPDIEDDVIIYANATILGGQTVIGKGAVIGANTWITESVPPGTRVYNK
ncbi:MAG: hypothetical protein LBB56_04635 [Chitinispirillales bacterium]|jgi:serine O-acetyltransferase|nr:hypothetical protein [Chitinispirillales bacterium]